MWVVTSPGTQPCNTQTWTWTPACTDNNPAFYKVQNMIIIVCDVECYQSCNTEHHDAAGDDAEGDDISGDIAESAAAMEQVVSVIL